MAIELDQRQGLIAGDGLLPVKMAQYAKENGFDVVCISLSSDNYREMDIHTYRKEDIKKKNEKKRKECLSGNINIDKKKKNYRMNSASNSFLSQVKITLFVL